MKEISVVVNRKSKGAEAVCQECCDFLAARGCRVQVCELPCDTLSGELAIVLGGDGSIMHIAKQAARVGIPILGINLGRIGYLAELEPSQIGALSQVICDSYRLEERMMLTVSYRGAEYPALNDLALTHANGAHLSEIGAMHNGTDIGAYLADGLIVATPTGSTAYSMSAGGAVIDPTLDCLCLTPICPISSRAKPLVFAGGSTLSFVNLSDAAESLHLTVDGVLLGEVAPGERVEVRRSERKATFLRLRQNSFCNILKHKMLEHKALN